MQHVLKLSLFFLLAISFFISLGVGLFALSHPEQAIVFLESLRPSPTIAPLQVKGIGVIGDSLSDEYRADDNRGLTYAPTTLNWVEILQSQRELPFGTWGIWEEPRRRGYEYNFARTGASITLAIESGQHTKLAEEIQKGKVNAVIIYLGVNDFSPLASDGYEAIYYNSLTDEQIDRKVNRLVADMKTIIQTLQKAGSVRILLITIPDWGRHLLVQLAYPIPADRQRVTNAVEEANSSLRELANEYHFDVAESDEFYESLEERSKDGVLKVGKTQIDTRFPGDDPHKLFLDDGVHPGTIYNGIFANFIISQMDKKWGMSVKSLSDQEILSTAGL